MEEKTLFEQNGGVAAPPLNEALRDVLADAHISAQDLMDAFDKIGRSTAYLICSGKYTGSQELLEKVMEFALKKLESRKSVWLSDWQETAYRSLTIARLKKDLCVLSGKSGVGKTFVIEKFARENENVLIWKAHLGLSFGGILASLLRLVDLPAHGTCEDKQYRLMKELKRREISMLIIDEADLIIGEGSVQSVTKKISIFREFYEANIPVALIGLDTMIERLYAVDKYISSRIGIAPLFTPPTREEMEEFFVKVCGFELSNLTRQIITRASSHGYFRYLTKVFDYSALFDGDIEKAASIIFGGL